jgi:nitrate/nitrite transporter NarK
VTRDQLLWGVIGVYVAVCVWLLWSALVKALDRRFDQLSWRLDNVRALVSPTLQEEARSQGKSA